jgi:feruloyl-CoA synthase
VPGVERFDPVRAGLPPFSPVAVRDDDPAEVLYTSGTTGKPKGCVHSHRNVVAAAITAALAVKLDEGDRMLVGMPLWHSSPLNNWFMGSQYVGATTVLLREYHPLHFLEAVQRERCTVYFGAPVSYLLPLQAVPHFDSFDLTSMRAWIYGGGPIGADTARVLVARYRTDRFYQVYGLTEAGPTGTVLLPDEQIAKAGSIGKRGLPGADLAVIKADGTEAKAGDVGEIWLRADSMMTGYLNDREATAAAFTRGWLRTGDVARVDPDGYLFIVDRLRDMVIVGGENVYSKTVEDAITAHPGVAQAAVVGKPHEDWGETVVAFVVRAKGAPVSADELLEFLGARLAKNELPREVLFVDALPMTPSGKVKKFQLRAQLART